RSGGLRSARCPTGLAGIARRHWSHDQRAAAGWADRTRDRSTATGGIREDEPDYRDGVVPVGKDGRPARRQHLHQAERLESSRGDRLCLRARFDGPYIEIPMSHRAKVCMVRPMRQHRPRSYRGDMTYTSERIDTLIIGAGQAGLSAAYHLRQAGRECLVVDANDRVGDNWRRHWDSLRLYTPAALDGLPGLPFPASRWSYPTKDEVADYLETYAATFELPVRGGIRVSALTAYEDGYRVEHEDGDFEANNVIIATGTFGRTPNIPAFADELDPRIVQLHSSEYKNPEQLQPGPVLVVGASHSGGDIAYELAAEHHVILSGRDTGEIQFRLDRRSARFI